jgi:hypothetical protein
MIQFVSLDTIIEDILKISRGSKISSSEPISIRQIELWIHQYRSILIKQDLDKGKDPNEDYIQELTCIKLVPEFKPGNNSLVSTDIKTYRTDLQIPKTIDFNFKSGITSILTLEGEEIQLVEASRSQWQQYKKYTKSDKLAYQKNGYVYIDSQEGLSYITIRGIFEVPTEAHNFVNELTQLNLWDISSPYPIPINMLGTLKDMILKREMNIMLAVPSDNKNDSQSKVESNTEQQPKE